MLCKWNFAGSSRGCMCSVGTSHSVDAPTTLPTVSCHETTKMLLIAVSCYIRLETENTHVWCEPLAEALKRGQHRPAAGAFTAASQRCGANTATRSLAGIARQFIKRRSQYPYLRNPDGLVKIAASFKSEPPGATALQHDGERHTSSVRFGGTAVSKWLVGMRTESQLSEFGRLRCCFT